MADHGRQPQPDLSRSRPADMDFFELLRRLEAGGRRFGGPGRPDREPARLGQEVRMGFAIRDVASSGRAATARRPASRWRSSACSAPRGRCRCT